MYHFQIRPSESPFCGLHCRAFSHHGVLLSPSIERLKQAEHTFLSFLIGGSVLTILGRNSTHTTTGTCQGNRQPINSQQTNSPVRKLPILGTCHVWNKMWHHLRSMKQSAAPCDCFIIVVQEQKHWNQRCDSKETLEMKQSCKLNRERGRGWGLGGGGNVVLYKAQMVLEKHVTEKWGDGGIRKRSVCLSDWPGGYNTWVESQTSGWVKGCHEKQSSTLPLRLQPTCLIQLWFLLLIFNWYAF